MFSPLVHFSSLTSVNATFSFVLRIYTGFNERNVLFQRHRERDKGALLAEVAGEED